jgi:hypothetical protein
MRRSLFVLLLVCAAIRPAAQTFNLQTGREPVVSLDGLWRFHTGDNPAWANPSFDDSQWSLLHSNESWSSQGYKNYGGFGWYRFSVEVPDGDQSWSLYLSRTLAVYQVFLDGRLLGSQGRMLSNMLSHSSPQVFGISPAAPGSRTIHIALRVWHNPIWAAYAPGGFLDSSFIGDSGLIAQRAATYRALQWDAVVDYYTVAVLGVLVGLTVLVLFFIRRGEREYLWFALLLLANAADVTLTIIMSLALIPVPLYDLLDATMQSAALFAALVFFSIVLRAPRSRIWWLVAGILLINIPTVGLYYYRLTSVGTAGTISTLAVLPATLWILFTLLKRATQRDRNALILLVPTLLWQGFALFKSILLITWQFGWQRWMGQWRVPLLRKPYVLSPDAAIDALFIFALLIFLIRRFSLARRQEERLAAEFEAAKTVQSLLIPAIPSSTPGFAVESVYLPASEVGGDFFQVLPGEDGSLLIVVGDVSGKGLKAAMTVSAIIGALRGCTLRKPSEVLAYLNRVLHGQITGFATCTAALISAEGAMTLANAGNLAPYRNGQELTIESSLPLGISPDATYSETTYQLHPEDRLTFLSDGVVEATNSNRELFGFERTHAISSQPAQAIAEAAKHFGQQDDISVLSVTFVPALKAALA